MGVLYDLLNSFFCEAMRSRLARVHCIAIVTCCGVLFILHMCLCAAAHSGLCGGGQSCDEDQREEGAP